MKYIIFSELNRNHFLFLTYLIITLIKDIDKHYIINTGDIVDTFNKYYLYTLSDFFSIIPFIIIKVRSKSISKNKLNLNISQTLSKENIEENNDIQYIQSKNDVQLIYLGDNNKDEKKRKKRIIKLLFIVSFFDFLSIYSNVTFSVIIKSTNYSIKKAQMNSYVLFNIIAKYLLNILILHTPVYKHHYLSLSINLLFLIGLVIYDIINIELSNQYFYLLMKIISVSLYSFEDAFAKILLTFNSISPYNLLLYRGILVNILALLYSIVFIFVEIPDEKGKKSCLFSRFWKVYENKLNILFYLILALFEYLENLNIFFIIDKFSLIHFAVASIIEYFGLLILAMIYKESGVAEFLIKFLIYFILIVTALIYNEFIILNFCGLEKYTKLFLQTEAKKEVNQSFIDNNEDYDSTTQRDSINIVNDSTDEFIELNTNGNKI